VEKNPLKNNLLKLEEMSPTENGASVKEEKLIDNATIF